MTSDVPYMPIRKFEEDGQKVLLDYYVNYFGGQSGKSKVKNELEDSFENGEEYNEYVKFILMGMRLEKYAPLFEKENIGVDVLLELTKEDLIEIGIEDVEDQNRLLAHLTQFNVPGYKRSILSYSELEIIEDDLIMARNVFRHLVELNAHISYIHYKSLQGNLIDYFINGQESALKILKRIINQCVIQTNRISNILFDGNCNGESLIATALRINNLELPGSVKNKLIKSNKKGRLRKKRVVLAAALIAGFVYVCISCRMRY